MNISLTALLLPFLAAAVSAGCATSNFCSGWKLMGYCKSTSQHFQWMKVNCPESCGFPCPTPKPACVDLIPSYCSQMVSKCNDAAYKDYLRSNCPKTCNACGNVTPTPVNPTTSSGNQCGIKAPGHTRIVGGSNARPGDWPWQVQIDYLNDYTRYWCGGTLINDEWILSAAHCFEDDKNPRNYHIYLGEHDIRNQSPNEQKFDIAEVIMHPSYDSTTADNDMVLLRLKKKASYTNYVRPACFPDTTTRFPSGEECYVTGWGALQTAGASPRILQQAKIPLISQRECTRAMGYGSITNSMICAGHSNKRIDSCQGDSGGPLVCRKKDNAGQDVWYLWGVVSWGIDCAKPGYYGVYASVETLGSWVQNTVKSRSG